MTNPNVLWDELITLTETELGAIEEHDLDGLEATNRRKSVLINALQQPADQIQTTLWSHVALLSGKLQDSPSEAGNLRQKFKLLSSLVEDLNYWGGLLGKLSMGRPTENREPLPSAFPEVTLSQTGETLTSLLVHHRDRLGLTQTNIALNAQMDESYVSRLFAGERVNPSRDILIRLALYGLELELEDANQILLAADYRGLTPSEVPLRTPSNVPSAASEKKAVTKRTSKRKPTGRTSRKTSTRGTSTRGRRRSDGPLGSEAVRVMSELIFSDHKTITDVVKILWPGEFNPQKKKNLIQRVYNLRGKALPVIERFFTDPALKAELSGEAQEFYERIREEFDSYAQLLSRIDRSANFGGGKKIREGSDESRSLERPSVPSAPSSAPVLAKPVASAARSGSSVNMGFVGGANGDQIKVLRAALVDAEPTFKLSDLQDRTGVVFGALRPILTGGLTRLQQVEKSAHDPSVSLSPEAQELLDQIHERWPGKTIEEIIPAIPVQ